MRNKIQKAGYVFGKMCLYIGIISIISSPILIAAAFGIGKSVGDLDRAVDIILYCIIAFLISILLIVYGEYRTKIIHHFLND